MKKFNLILMGVAVFVLLMGATCFAKDQQDRTQLQTISSTQFSCGESKNLIAQLSQKKRGCCSWHGGVCGCSNGRVVCCDQTLSPSCTCRAEQ